MSKTQTISEAHEALKADRAWLSEFSEKYGPLIERFQSRENLPLEVKEGLQKIRAGWEQGAIHTKAYGILMPLLYRHRMCISFIWDGKRMTLRVRQSP